MVFDVSMCMTISSTPKKYSSMQVFKQRSSSVDSSWCIDGTVKVVRVGLQTGEMTFLLQVLTSVTSLFRLQSALTAFISHHSLLQTSFVTNHCIPQTDFERFEPSHMHQLVWLLRLP